MSWLREHNLDFWNEAGDLIDADLKACGDDLKNRVRELCARLEERGAGEGDLLAVCSQLRDDIGDAIWETINKIRVAP